MKIVAELKLVDDDGKVLIHHEGFVPLECSNPMTLVQQWTAEKVCSIRTQAIELEQKADG